MTQEKSAIREWLDECDKTKTLALELETFSIWVTDKGLALDISCKFVPSLREKMHGEFYIKDEKSAYLLENLPITLRFRQVTIPQGEAVGTLEFYEAMDSGDGVVNTQACVVGSLGLAAATLERMVAFFSGGIGPWNVVITVTGLDKTQNGDKNWDTTKNRHISVTESFFKLNDQPLTQSSLENTARDLSLTRIEKYLDSIETKIEAGVKVRLFG